jgi:hypothetical protein
MTAPSRLQVALPAVLTFVFGLAFGLVAGRILWVTPADSRHAGVPRSGEAEGMAGDGGGMTSGEAQDMGDGSPDPRQMRAMLDAHLKLLKDKPDDLNLTRTVGNYHAMLGENDEALVLYARAREIAETTKDEAQITDIMIDEGIALVDKNDVAGGLRRLEEASARDPKDVRSRLTRVAVYMQRVMPQPPPGFDRKIAINEAERLLDEVQAIDPANPFGSQFRATI